MTVHQLLSLPRAELGVLARATVLLPAARLSLHVCGVQRTLRWFDPVATRHARLRPAAVDPVRAGRLVNAAASWMGGSCLVRSLVLQRILARQGTASELKIGVSLDAPRFEAHAWVEVDGTPVNDASHVRARHAGVFEDVGRRS